MLRLAWDRGKSLSHVISTETRFSPLSYRRAVEAMVFFFEDEKHVNIETRLDCGSLRIYRLRRALCRRRQTAQGSVILLKGWEDVNKSKLPPGWFGKHRSPGLDVWRVPMAGASRSAQLSRHMYFVHGPSADPPKLRHRQGRLSHALWNTHAVLARLGLGNSY